MKLHIGPNVIPLRDSNVSTMPALST